MLLLSMLERLHIKLFDNEIFVHISIVCMTYNYIKKKPF